MPPKKLAQKPPPPSTSTSSSSASSPKIPPPTTPHATFSSSTTTFSSTPRTKPQPQNTNGGSISRSISACNRCRARKTKCDQLFPSCTACTRASVECVGIDAATGREIPRSYVDWLEKRVKHLEAQLKLDASQPEPEPEAAAQQQQQQPEEVEPDRRDGGHHAPGETKRKVSPVQVERGGGDRALRLRPDIENLIDQVGVVGVQGTSATGFMGGSSGISFARLMFTAVKMQGEQQAATGEVDPAITSTLVSRNRQSAQPVPFPKKEVAERLLEVYFQQANPQFPILHRPTFDGVFRRVWGRIEKGVPQGEEVQQAADLYFCNMCFAIAAAMSTSTDNLPERYHATAMKYMDNLFSSISMSNDRLAGLKAVLLLGLYSMMRPAAPGVWYVLGTALRLAVDLGLHQENTPRAEKLWDPLALDERRRLFWCTYSIDRQVCVYLGRPFGISDDAVKAPFPLDVNDERITAAGILPEPPGQVSSRKISLHMFQIRRLQSEIQRVLYQNAQIPRPFQSLEDWRHDMEGRLQNWAECSPKSQSDAGCGYNLGFIDLNYHQTRLLLYGLSPAVPIPSQEAFEIIAEAGSKIMNTYRHLHRKNSINYTWLACHNLFMAGTSYICALWHSPTLRLSIPISHIHASTLSTLEIFTSMTSRCPAAQSCHDVFESLASATLQLFADTSSHTHKRMKLASTPMPDGADPGWSPPPTTAYRVDPGQGPASLANLLHHAPPTRQDGYVGAGGYEMEWGGVGNGARAPAMVGGAPFVMGPSGEMHVADGRGLFEMLQEVGVAGNPWEGMGQGWGYEAWTGGGVQGG